MDPKDVSKSDKGYKGPKRLDVTGKSVSTGPKGAKKGLGKHGNMGKGTSKG